MSGKRLLPLVALLVLLVAAAIVLKRQPTPTRLSEEVGFERLVPQALRTDRISGLDLYQGAQPEDLVRLRRQDDAWVVASHYDAPVRADKITPFLDSLSALEGELRSDHAELLGDFHLDTAQALHVQIYTDDQETSAVHLLAGKGRGRNSFMRIADDNRVYSVNLNLHRESGLSGDNTDQTPQAKPWLDLHIQNLPSEPVTALALHTPARRWRFVRQQPTPPSPAPPQTGTATKPPWTLAEPKVAFAVKQEALDGLISTLRTLRAEDVADPAKLVEYGLDEAPYRVTLAAQPEAEQDARQATLWIGNEVPEQAGKRYARLGQEGPLYILPQWVFGRLFPQGKELLDLHILRVQPQEVTRLTWQQDGASWSLERSASAPEATPEAQAASAWRLVEAPRVTVQTQEVNTLLAAITPLTADDWIEPSTPPTHLGPPVLTLTLTLRDGHTERLALGKDEQGHYASVQGTPGLFVVPEAAYTTLLEALTTLHPANASAASVPPETP